LAHVDALAVVTTPIGFVVRHVTDPSFCGLPLFGAMLSPDFEKTCYSSLRFGKSSGGKGRPTVGVIALPAAIVPGSAAALVLSK
jgi:hypothetical protein